MTHEITIRADGSAEMAYTGAVPWHGLGNKLEPGASRDTWCKAAGMDFEILRAPVRFEVASLENLLAHLENRDVLYRSDTNKGLSVVSNQFNIVQPGDVLDYFDKLSTNHGFVMSTAGTLNGGRRFWGLADIGEEAIIADPRDKVRGRLLMATSIDGSLATVIKFVHERVVCSNTLGWALGEVGNEIRIIHRDTFDPDLVNLKLGIHEKFEVAMERLRALAHTDMDDQEMIEATVRLINPKAFELDSDDFMHLMGNSKPIQRINELAIDNRAIGAEFDGCAGTAWGWLNSVTQYVDHEMPARSIDSRINKAWFGVGDQLKTRALKIAMQTAGGDTVYVDQDEDGFGDRLLDAVLENTYAQ